MHLTLWHLEQQQQCQLMFAEGLILAMKIFHQRICAVTVTECILSQ